MKTFVTSFAAVLITAVSAAPSWGCGAYFFLLDSVVESALSSDMRVAVPACVQLRKLGDEGIARCRSGVIAEEYRATRLRARLRYVDVSNEKSTLTPDEFRAWVGKLERGATDAEAKVARLKQLIPALERARRATVPEA